MSNENRTADAVWRTAASVLVLMMLASIVVARQTFAEDHVPVPLPFRGALLIASEVRPERLVALRDQGTTTVALLLEATTEAERTHERRAANDVLAARLKLAYWVEVARCPQLADENPQWMASLQTHNEWRRFFPETPMVKPDQVAKTYPWIPILSREPFAAQLKRVKSLLADRPVADIVFLNDLQGAPSACGCGNPLCRWTSDYGKKRTTTPLGDDAAVLFVNAVRQAVPTSSVIPVWTTECEEHDGAADGLCAGVGCFDGICWKAYAQQLMPLAQSTPTIGVLTLYREFHRDLPVYGEKAGWVTKAIETFAAMPPRHGGSAIAASRIIAVLQGWDVTDDEVTAQIQAVSEAHAAGYLVAFAKLEQNWQPKVISIDARP